MPQRAAIYARFSSHNQRSESIEIQVDNCLADDLSPEKICGTFVKDIVVDDDVLHICFMFDGEQASDQPVRPGLRWWRRGESNSGPH